MTLVRSEVYEALREIGVSQDKALKAAAVLVCAPEERDLLAMLQGIQQRLRILLCLTSAALGLNITILLKLLER